MQVLLVPLILFSCVWIWKFHWWWLTSPDFFGILCNGSVTWEFSRRQNVLSCLQSPLHWILKRLYLLQIYYTVKLNSLKLFLFWQRTTKRMLFQSRGDYLAQYFNLFSWTLTTKISSHLGLGQTLRRNNWG